ncbi:hypothetical protein BKA69DRAFT_443824 [Paraphysoderma sedebokerense]|nr:hypothetical protein BKA69DRAFT_443824 [Paraphysoderma sedebokerense]
MIRCAGCMLICKKQISKYTCPRCNLKYCCLSCYKSDVHRNCTESFYQNVVMDEIKGLKASDEQVKGMKDILQRLEANAIQQELEFDEDEDQSDMAARFADLDLESADPEEILNRLTPEEREEFEKQLLSAKSENPDLAELVPIWVPWWKQSTDLVRPLISEVDDSNPDDEVTAIQSEVSSSRPDVIADIPNLMSISPSPPNENLVFNLIDILFAYSAVCRYFNGEIHNFPHDSAQMMLTLCQILSSFEPFAFDDVQSVVASCIYIATSNPTYFNSPHQLPLLFSDISALLSTPSNLLSSLSDLFRLFETTSHSNPPSYTTMTSTKRKQVQEFKKKSFRVSKKVWWYLCWCKWVEIESSNDEGVQKEGNRGRRNISLLQVVQTSLEVETKKWENEFRSLENGKEGINKVMEKVRHQGKRIVGSGSLIQEVVSSRLTL